jgi:hypothetical protein
MAEPSSKLQRLHDHNIIDMAQLSEEDKQAAEKLSNEEVDFLIKMKEKLGHAKPGQMHLRPNVLL